MSLADFLMPDGVVAIPRRIDAGPPRAQSPFGGPAVGESQDLERILALPRRPVPSLDERVAMAAGMTARLRLPPGPCQCAALNPTAKARGQSPCITDLNPIQGWYLYEAALVGGTLGFVPIGAGKTGIDILLPMVLPACRTYVLMLSPSLVDQFQTDFELWSQHFRTPNLAGGRGPFDALRPTLRILKYSQLSRPNFGTWLKAIGPDAFGCDEAHELKDTNAVRTDRFIRYFEEAGRPVRAFFHSGSLTTRGIEDYSHLAALGLGAGSPAPIAPAVVRQWGSALNPSVGRAPAPMGALRRLCNTGEKAREGYARRLLETPGVISTEDSSCAATLRMFKRDPGPMPDLIVALLRQTRERAKRPDGEELTEKVEVAKVCRQLASGFFYRWKYPRGEPEDLIDRWFNARQAWHREVRSKLEHRSDMLDSPALCEEAARRYYEDRTDGPSWRSATWPAWLEIKDQVQPQKDTVWLDDFLAADAARWLRSAPGIAWYGSIAFGDRLRDLTGMPIYRSKHLVENLRPTAEMVERKKALERAGLWKETAASWLQVEDGTRSIVCAIKAFHKGVNLQSFNRALVCQPPSDGGIWEQMLGREHRFGQPAEFVDVWVYRHTREFVAALDDAQEYAAYVRSTTQSPQRLLSAVFDFQRGTVS